MGIGVTQRAVLHVARREREADTSCGVTCYNRSKMTLKSIFSNSSMIMHADFMTAYLLKGYKG